jgi:hypothetical protein
VRGTTVDRCARCGARVQWVRTERDTPLMLDVTPTPHGHVAVVDGVAVLVLARLPPPPPGAPRYTHHMRTCGGNA